MLPLVVVISQVPPVAVRGTWTLPLAVSVRKTLSESRVPETLPLVERTVRVLGVVVCSFYRFGTHCLSFRSPSPRGHNKHELGMTFFLDC